MYGGIVEVAWRVRTHFRLSRFRQDVREKSVHFLYVKRTHTFHFKSKNKEKKRNDSRRTHVEGKNSSLPWIYLFILNAPSRPLIYEWRKYAEAGWSGPIAHFHFSPTKYCSKRFINNKEKTKPFAYVAARRMVFFFTNTPSRIEFVRVVCGSGRMNGMVWIDLPIKSAATNVLNGFKMSFWCVFLRPYLLDRPVVVCLSLHLHLLLLLLLRMLHIEHKLFIFIVVSYNFTTCLNAVAMLAINATHAYCVTYYFICCEGGRSSLNPNYIFSLFTLKKETCMYVTAHARMAYRIRIFSGFGTRASWRCLWTYGCNGKHMWILFFVVDLVRFKNCCTEKPKIFAIILTNRNRNRNADEKNRILHPCQGPRGMVNWW